MAEDSMPQTTRFNGVSCTLTPLPTLTEEPDEYQETTMPQIASLSIDSSTVTPSPTLGEHDGESQHTIRDDFFCFYDMGKMIGKGGYGTVHQCFLKGDESKSFAVKIVGADKYDHHEVQILEILAECQNITHVIDFFQNDLEVYIVMEEMKGGDLLDRIHERECCFGEANTKALFKTLLETVREVHACGCVHGDLKPENVLLRYKDDDSAMQLADFGFAQVFRSDEEGRIPMFDQVGTFEYMAPELFIRREENTDGYDERVDVWSLGVILFVLLGGYQPFEGEDQEERIRQTCAGNFEFDEDYWMGVSAEAKQLVTDMLKVNPVERFSVEDALASKWFHS